MGLYWIRPYTYLNLDSRTRWFIQNYCPDLVNGNVKAFKDVPDGETYLTLCDLSTTNLAAGNYSYKNLPELSYAAYVESERINAENKKVSEEVRRWLMKMQMRFIIGCMPQVPVAKNGRTFIAKG